MGFKCPICLKDFKRDRIAWQNHCDKCCDGAASDFVKVVITSIQSNSEPTVDENGEE